MDDSAINQFLSSSEHLENVEQLIKNLERQTLDVDNFEHILSHQNRHDIITKSFSSVSVNPMAIDDTPDDSFLVKSISLTSHGAGPIIDGNLSMDSLFNHRDLFEQSEYKQQQTPPANDQSLYADQDVAFTWDDQYDTRANYRLTFSTDKQLQAQSTKDSKKEKSHRHKHHHRHHHHRNRTNDPQTSSMCSDDGLSITGSNQINDWSMRSSFNAFEQSSIDQGDSKSGVASERVTAQQQGQQSTNFIRSQSHPTSFSPPQQLPNNKDNTSPNSSTTSSSSSASWRKMKDSQRTTSGMEPKETRPPSPLNLYKIFQQKSQMAASSSSRSAFQFYRQQGDSVVPNTTDSMTISGEKLQNERARTSSYQKRAYSTDRRSSQTATPSTDQAIQTSMYMDSSATTRFQTPTSSAAKSESYDQLSSQTNSNSSNQLTVPSRPSPAPIGTSTVHKSLPDLAFISQYSKELPRSRTVSPLPPSASTSGPSLSLPPAPPPPSAPSPIPPRQDADRPRTLKSIKRYKNSKHCTEPLGVFYSPQLRKTFAAVPASAVITGSNESPTIIKMKLPMPPSAASPIPMQSEQSQTSNLKSCLKYGSRANSCDIQAMLDGGKASATTLTIPEPLANQNSISPNSKRRCSETDSVQQRPDSLWAPNAFPLQDFPRDRYSEHDLAFILQQQNQTKKSVSFSENIAKHLISPCNPAIKFDPTPDTIDDQDDTNDEMPPNNELTLALHGKKTESNRKPLQRYGEMRRCQTDIIVMDRVHHLHSFTESPPNEFCFQADPDNESDDDQAMMKKAHVNIIPDGNEEPVPVPTIVPEPATTMTTTNENNISFNDKENEIPPTTVNTNNFNSAPTTIQDANLNGLLEKVTATVKHIFDIKRSEKTFFLSNEQNTQLDNVLKNELCTNIQQMLEHGLKLQRKDLSQNKQMTLWKIIEASVDHGSSLQAFHDARQVAQNASPYWVYQLQAFIFTLLNKNELINWLYHYMKLKELLQRHYQSPEALVLVATSATFNLFDRIMAQLEKLTPLAFRLAYIPPPLPSHINESLSTSTISAHSNKNSPRDWVMSISRRTSKTLTQPIVSTATIEAKTEEKPATESFGATITRKFGAMFSKTNSSSQAQRKTSSAVTARLPTPKPTITNARAPSPAGATSNASTTTSRRPRGSNVFLNANAAATTTSKPVIVASPKLNNTTRAGSIRRGISPSVVVAPSPPPTINTSNTTFQSKIPRPSLNVDKPKSTRYRSTALPPK